MARYRRGKMALYEVMSKARLKRGYGRTLEKVRTDQDGEAEPVVDKEESVVAEEAAVTDAAAVREDSAVADSGAAGMPGASFQWRRKPRVVQYNSGRIELSIPYQIGIALVLGLVALVLIAYQAGQRSLVKGGVQAKKPVNSVGGNRLNPVVGPGVGPRENVKVVKESPSATENSGAVMPKAGNVIVLVQHNAERDLVPVRAHFASYGIATEIVRWDNRFYLVTQDRYESVAGGDGRAAIRRIAEVGKEYKGKAPKGYEPFAPHYFSDAYGQKVDEFGQKVK